MKINKKLSSLIFLALFLVNCSKNETTCEIADVVLTNATIYTLNESIPVAESLAFLGNTIVFVGSNVSSQNYQCGEAEVIDLEGNYVYPGFVDSHAHLKGIGRRENSLNLQGIKSLKEMLTAVEIYSNGIEPGEWVVGRGWIEKVWPEKRFPTRYELDRFSSDKPVILERADGHAVVVNSLALKLAGISSESIDPHGGRIEKDKNGQPTGMLIDRATSLVEKLIPKRTKQEDKRDFKAGIDRNVSLGWTQVQIAGGTFSDIKILEEIREEGNLSQRVYFAVSAGKPAESLLKVGSTLDPTNMLTIRSIKLYADGALGSRGAWLLEEYSDAEGVHGHNVTPMEDIEEVVMEGLKNGFQMCTHAIGDRANREVLDIYERAFSKYPEQAKDSRFRIEHAQHIHPEDIPRFAELGVLPAMQAIHMSSDRPWAIDRLGKERIENGAYMWSELIDNGSKIVNGTDAPVEPVSALASFYASVSRKTLKGNPEGGYEPTQKMTREEALKSYTIWPAYGAFMEDVTGSIEEGKLADFTVLDTDIMTVADEEILKAKVKMTIIDGKIVFEN